MQTCHLFADSGLKGVLGCFSVYSSSFSVGRTLFLSKVEGCMWSQSPDGRGGDVEFFRFLSSMGICDDCRSIPNQHSDLSQSKRYSVVRLGKQNVNYTWWHFWFSDFKVMMLTWAQRRSTKDFLHLCGVLWLSSKTAPDFTVISSCGFNE